MPVQNRLSNPNTPASPNLGKVSSAIMDFIDALCWLSLHQGTIRFHTVFNPLKKVKVYFVEASIPNSSRSESTTDKDELCQILVSCIKEMEKYTKLKNISPNYNCVTITKDLDDLNAEILWAYRCEMFFKFSTKPVFDPAPYYPNYNLHIDFPNPFTGISRYPASLRSVADYVEQDRAADQFFHYLKQARLYYNQVRYDALELLKKETAGTDLTQTQLDILEQLSHWYSLGQASSGQDWLIIETGAIVAKSDFKALKTGKYIEAIQANNQLTRWGITKRGLRLLNHS